MLSAGNRLGCSSHFIYQSPYKNRHVHLLGKHWPPKCFVLFSFHVVYMIHCVDLTIWVCLLVCKQKIPRATRESFNNPSDRGQVSLTMRSLGVNEPAQYTVSTKDGRMMIDAKGWSRFKTRSNLTVGDDVKIELSRQGKMVQLNFEILQ